MQTIDYETCRVALKHLCKIYNNKKPQEFDDNVLVKPYFILASMIDISELRAKWPILQTRFDFYPTPKQFGEVLGLKSETLDPLESHALAVQSEINGWLNNPNIKLVDLTTEARVIIGDVAPSPYDLRNNQTYYEKAGSLSYIKKKLQHVEEIKKNHLLIGAKREVVTEEETSFKIIHKSDPERKVLNISQFVKDLSSGIKDPVKAYIEKPKSN